jgi:hypothetical protein
VALRVLYYTASNQRIGKRIAPSKRPKISGLENRVIFVSQEASKIDPSWPPIVALEICNFLILCSPYISGKLNSHIFVLGPKLPLIRHVTL